MDYEIELRYQKLNKHLEKTFGDDLDVHALLFLIGVNELGKGHNKYSITEDIRWGEVRPRGYG